MTDTAYFDRRERQERALAAASTDPVARRLNLEPAARYAARLRHDAGEAPASLSAAIAALQD